jgi:hypothetical protein
MSETHTTTASGGGQPLDYGSPYLNQGKGSLIQIGGALGIAGGILGLLIFFAACFGFEAAFMFSPITLLFGVVGIVFSIVGGTRKHPGVEDTSVLAAMMINFVVIVGGVLLMAAWLRYDVLPRSGM